MAQHVSFLPRVNADEGSLLQIGDPHQSPMKLSPTTTDQLMKSAGSSDLNSYLEKNDARIREELFEFLRIPSVSARSEHSPDVARAAAWLKECMEKSGMAARIY